MAYSSARAILGGADVRKTTKQTKPKSYSSVAATLGGAQVAASTAAAKVARSGGSGRAVTRAASTAQKAYGPSGTTTAPSGAARPSVTAPAAVSGNRARQAAQARQRAARAKMVAREAKRRARSLRAVVRKIHEPEPAPPRIERRVKTELAQHATGRQQERVRGLEVKIVPEQKAPVKIARGTVSIPRREAIKATHTPTQKTPGQKVTKPDRGEETKRSFDRINTPKERRVAGRLERAAKRKTRGAKVPEIVPPQFRAAVAKHGKMVPAPAGMTGPEYLGKLIEFESGWSPTAENPSSAYGLGQFIDSTAEDFRSRLGVETQDPKRPNQMIKGAAMHASGKYGYGALYAGYNPGYGSDPIPAVEGGAMVPAKKPKPIPKPLKRQAKRVLGAPQTRKIIRKAQPQGTAKPKPKAGEWAGAQRAVLQIVPKSARAEGRGDKRTPEENAAVGGSDTSDHLTTNTKAYAADLPADDALARKIAKRLGMASHTGTNEVVKDGYRYQLIWQDEGHYDHIHLGAEWVGAGVPPGTVAGSVGGLTTGGTVTSTAATAPTAAPTMSEAETAAGAAITRAEGTKTKKQRRKLKRKREADEKLRRALALIRSDPNAPEPTSSYAPAESDFAAFARSRPVKVAVK